MNMSIFEGYRKLELDNGFFAHMQKTPTRTVDMMLDVGIGYAREGKNERGITHFLEHCMVGGGSQRYEPEDVERIRRMNYTSISTSIDKTKFYADVICENTTELLSLFSDMAFKPAFKRDRVEQERKRVIEEILLARSNLGYKQDEVVRHALYKKSPLRYDGYGDLGIIRSRSIGDIREYHERGFHPDNTKLFLAGGLPDDVEEIVRRFFGQLKTGNVPSTEYPVDDNIEQKMIEVDRPDIERSLMGLYFIVPADAKNPDWFPSWVMRGVLGGYTYSRLQKTLSYEHGLTYGIYIQNIGTLGTGVLSISTDVDYCQLPAAKAAGV